MANKMQFKRGLADNLPSSAAAGEPVFATDTGRLYIGTGSSLVPINPAEYGTWTPVLRSRGGTAPTCSSFSHYSFYYRIGDMVYIQTSIRAVISNAGSGYAGIGGLPFCAGIPNTWGYASLSLGECYGLITEAEYTLALQALIFQPEQDIMIQSPDGTTARTWKATGGGISISGWYHLLA